jgi:putative PEP-CTERM system histidine kinase
MLLFSLESVFTAVSFKMASATQVGFWQTLAFLTKSVLAGVWLCFSLTYSRGNYREFLKHSRLLLIAVFLLPACLLPALSTPFIGVAISDGQWWLQFGRAAKVLNGLLLISSILIVMNLERTFRSAVGTMRWRIKFFILGLGLVFGTRVYTHTEALLFSGQSLALAGLDTGALLMGCTLMTIAYVRSGFGDIDVYPSRAALHTSITVLVAGGYLFVVGVLAQIVAGMGGLGNFQVYAFLMLLGIVLLVVLLLSDRFRQYVEDLISRHFKRPRYDSRQIWSRFTQCMSKALDETKLCEATAKLISSTFNTLSVTIWLYDEAKDALIFAASTSKPEGESAESVAGSSLAELRKVSQVFNLERSNQQWAARLKEISYSQFREGGDRVGVPIVAGDRWLGLIILADRVRGVRYTFEEYDLLKSISDQIAVTVLNLHLTGELLLGKEREAFQNISAFFVHDLKNTASTLNLMLQNLPAHFDDPAFRKDALQGISKAAGRLNQLIERLSALRRKLELKPTECDLNQLVTEALDTFNDISDVELIKDLGPLPKLQADRDQLQSVIMNVLLNAREAVGSKGQVIIRTQHHDGWAALSISDNGCGMSSGFIRDSLFRPFQTTKKKGLGIGMFQSKMIVEAHRGTIQVQSEVGMGTTFRIMLPLKMEVA